MKKAILISFMVGIAVMLGSWGTAQALLPAPTMIECGIDDDNNVCFDWSDVDGAVKYSVDVDVEVDTGDGPMTVELSFGTSDRTDGGDMGNSDLCVPLDEFVYIDGEGVSHQLSGPATAKVKALNPGKDKGRQNNPFSTKCTVFLPE